MMQHHSTLPSDIPVLRIRAVGRLAGFNGISTLGLSGIVSAETIEADETIVGVAVKLRGKTRTYTDHQSAKSASSVVQDSSHPSSHFLLHIASVVYQSPELVLFDKLPEGRCTSSTAAVKFTYNTPTHIECEFEGQIETNRRLPPTVAKHTFFEMLVTVKRQRQRQNNSLAGTSDEDFCTLHEAPQTLRDSTTSIEVTEHVFPISHIPYFDEERVTALLSPVKFTYEFEVAGHDGKPIFYDVSIDRTTFSPSQDINFKIRSSPHHDPHHQLVYLGFSLNEYYVISGSMHQQQQQQHQKTTELIEDESANTYITRKLSDTESFTTVPTAGNSGERFFSSLSDIFDPNSMQLDGAGTGTAGPTTLNLGRKFRITGKNKYLVWSESEKELPPVSEINGSLLRRGSATSNNSTLSSTLITKFTHSNKNLDLNSGVGRRFRMTVPPVSDVYPSGNWHKIKVKHKIKITLRFVTSQSPRRGSKASLNSTERRNSNLDQPKLVIVEKIIECPVTVTSFNTLMAEAANGFIQRFGVKADPTFTTSTDGHDAIMVSEQKQPISPPPPTRASIFNGPTIIVHEPELHPPLSTVDEAAAAATSTTISAVALSSQMPELLKPNTNHHRVEMEYDLPPLSPSFSAEIIDNRNSPSRLMDMINEEEYDERKSGEVGEATGADEDLASSTVSSDHPKTPPKTSSDIPSIMRLTTNYAAATETNDYQQQKQNEQQLMLNLQPKLFIPPPPLYSPPAFLKANHERISFLQPTSASEAAATLDGEEEEDDDEDDEVAAALTNAVQKLSPTAISLSTYSSPIKSKAQRGRNHQSINVLQLAHLADEFYNHSKLGQQVISIDTAEDDAEEDGVEDEDLMMLNGRIVSMKRAKQKDDQNALVYEYEENEEEGGAGVVISGHQQKQQQKGSHQLDSWFAGMAQRLSIHHHQH